MLKHHAVRYIRATFQDESIASILYYIHIDSTSSEMLKTNQTTQCHKLEDHDMTS